jgi:putative ABC transport system substrate-binding protein
LIPPNPVCCHPGSGQRMQFSQLKRRKFITLLGGTAAWPLAARAQQPAMPAIGFMSARSAGESVWLVAAFRSGLNESGFVEGQNVAIEYRWADNHYERLPTLAADLVGRQVAVIAAISGTPSVLAAKAATKTIPIVFGMGSDPVAFGVVTSLSRPGENITGASFFSAALGAKRLELLREIAPKAKTMAVLVNPTNLVSESEGMDMQAAAQAVGQQISVLKASTEDQIDRAFGTIVEDRIGALLVAADPFLHERRNQLVALAARHAVPAIYFSREFAQAGGLMSYGTNQPDTYRQAGAYVGRILKGEKPADLPVMLPTKFVLMINLKTAKALGLTVPLIMQMTADEVIE